MPVFFVGILFLRHVYVLMMYFGMPFQEMQWRNWERGVGAVRIGAHVCRAANLEATLCRRKKLFLLFYSFFFLYSRTAIQSQSLT